MPTRKYPPIACQIVGLLLFGSACAGNLGQARAESSAGLWQTDQPGFRPDLTYPILYTLSLQGVSVAFISSLESEESGFTGPSWHNFQEAFTKGPQWDDDAWYWNYAAHPLSGSESYLRARAQGCTPAGSFLFSTAASTVHEFLIESWFERPSWQDLIVTPLAGSLIGEARFQAKRSLLETNTRFSRTLAVAIDPIQSLAEVIGDAFGQDWREPAFRKAPLTAGQSYPLFITELASNNKGNLSLNFKLSISF